MARRPPPRPERNWVCPAIYQRAIREMSTCANPNVGEYDTSSRTGTAASLHRQVHGIERHRKECSLIHVRQVAIGVEAAVHAAPDHNRTCAVYQGQNFDIRDIRAGGPTAVNSTSRSPGSSCGHDGVSDAVVRSVTTVGVPPDSETLDKCASTQRRDDRPSCPQLPP